MLPHVAKRMGTFTAGEVIKGDIVLGVSYRPQVLKRQWFSVVRVKVLELGRVRFKSCLAPLLSNCVTLNRLHVLSFFSCTSFSIFQVSLKRVNTVNIQEHFSLQKCDKTKPKILTRENKEYKILVFLFKKNFIIELSSISPNENYIPPRPSTGFSVIYVWPIIFYLYPYFTYTPKGKILKAKFRHRITSSLNNQYISLEIHTSNTIKIP